MMHPNQGNSMDAPGGNMLNVLQSNAIMNFRTGNIMIDMIITSLIFSLFGYIGSLLTNLKDMKNNETWKTKWLSRISRKKSITIVGEKIDIPSEYHTSFNYSYSFRAVLEIIKNLDYKTAGIKFLKECQIERDREIRKDTDVFIVDQPTRFKLTNDIFCEIQNDEQNRESNSGNRSTSYTIKKCSMEIFSYKKSLSEINDWIKSVTEKYRENVAQSRQGKLFIYTLMNLNTDDGDKWHETSFKSNRTFNNMFSDELDNLKQKLDFFLQNEEWYNSIGSPYTFGALLHGPPGTGKTSAVKAIANYTKRHLVVIPLSKIKKSNDLFKVFFETSYTWENRHNPISFKDKIILFEDIDCMSDVIQKREDVNLSKTNQSGKNSDDELSTREMLKIIMDGEEDKSKEYMKLCSNASKKDDEITLSFILNLIDGIRETPGRIILMSSNHPEKIDPALIRPGRIDMKVNLGYASLNSIIKIYKQIYGEELEDKYYAKIRSNTFSPAEIYNKYFSANSKEDFIQKISSS